MKLKYILNIIILFLFFLSSCKDDKETQLPLLSTTDITDITQTTAKCGGIILSDGGAEITEKGICWSESHSPTVLERKTVVSGSMSFSVTITNLLPNTTYYIRAYAINEEGISYGNEKNLNTLPLNKEDTTISGNILFVEINESEGSLIVNAETDAEDTSYSLSDENNIFLTCKNIDDIISFHQSQNITLLNQNIDYLSDKFIKPLEHFIDKCEVINIKCNLYSVKIPYEFLKIDGEFLYTKKPVVYSFVKISAGDFLIINPEKGLIVSDPTADPENACGTIADNKENSFFSFSNNITISTIEKTTGIDFLLFSVHGAIDLNTCIGFIGIHNQNLYPGSFNQKNLKLIYFDSCHQGKSINFINKFHDLEAQYYLGPIISNEAGNSSTKTIINFFDYLKTYNPVISLFKTKQVLKSYTNSNILEELFFAAPFRIYKLN